MNLGLQAPAVNEETPEVFALTASRKGWPDQTEYYRTEARANSDAITWREQGFDVVVVPITRFFKD